VVIKSQETGLPNRIVSEKDGAEMVLIPAGEFEMGSPKNDDKHWERPIHTVYLDAFYMDAHPVTNSQYQMFIEETGYPAPKKTPAFSHPQQPVVWVTWWDAMEYARWAGKTLPFEAQWEKAARGGFSGKLYPWGDEEPNPELAGYNSIYRTVLPVRSFPPNGYGLYDMAGTVWELCMDEWQEDFYSRSTRENPVAGGFVLPTANLRSIKSLRVTRGGSWHHKAEHGLEVFHRSYSPIDFTEDFQGFRCVKPVLPR
jgi:formylglycine-generating enzyme required for sulfatase activity